MARVIFEINIKEDALNIVDSVLCGRHGGYDFSKNVSPELARIIKNNPKKKAIQIIYKKRQKFYKKNARFLRLALRQFGEAWDLISADFFKRLEKITKRPVCSKKFTACLTTTRRCPYNYKHFWFMVSLSNPPIAILSTAAHEILHMQVIHGYKELFPKQIHDAKWAWDLIESLTFLLNEEFSDLLVVPDNGYPAHQKLRARLLKEWRKDKNFERFLPKAIEITKKVMKKWK